MNWVKLLLWVNGAAFVGYGAACLLVPTLPAEYAGFSLATVSGTVEIVAMYGGLQIGFGLLLLVGARDETKRTTVLLALALAVGSLGSARLLGIALHGSSAYNLGALGYELTTAVLALLAMRSAADAEAPA